MHADAALKADVYIREGGSGILPLKEDGKGRLALFSGCDGVNAHTCALEGKIQNRKALMKDDDVDALGYAPSEREVYLPTLAAARVNLKLYERAEKTARRKEKR